MIVGLFSECVTNAKNNQNGKNEYCDRQRHQTITSVSLINLCYVNFIHHYSTGADKKQKKMNVSFLCTFYREL